MTIYFVRGRKEAGGVVQTASDAANAIVIIKDFERKHFITYVCNEDGRECSLRELEADAAAEDRYFGVGHIARLL